MKESLFYSGFTQDVDHFHEYEADYNAMVSSSLNCFNVTVHLVLSACIRCYI
jgi:hypothetical protein